MTRRDGRVDLKDHWYQRVIEEIPVLRRTTSCCAAPGMTGGEESDEGLTGMRADRPMTRRINAR